MAPRSKQSDIPIMEQEVPPIPEGMLDVEPTTSATVYDDPTNYPSADTTYYFPSFDGTIRPKGKVYAAMARAQVNIGNITKNSENPHFRSKFVDLGAAMEVILPALNAEGLSLVQETSYDDQIGWILNTTIFHEDGSYIGPSVYPILAANLTDPQKFGAGLTYARRYSAMAIVGAAPEDDDGNTATASSAKVKPKTAKQKLGPMLKAAGINSASMFREQSQTVLGKGVENFADLTEADAKKWLGTLDNGTTTEVPF